jgi:hypothetical protein
MKKNSIFFFGMLVMVLVFGLVFTSCPQPTDDKPGKTPEGKTEQERWSTWVDSSSGVTVENSVDGGGVCTITIGGTAGTVEWDGSSRYEYTVEAGKKYKYTFQAWTDSPPSTRTLNVQYYGGGSGGPYLSKTQAITTTPTEYNFTGDAIPLSQVTLLEFRNATVLGTFHVKIISIEPILDPKWQGTYSYSGDFVTLGATSGSYKIGTETGTIPKINTGTGGTIKYSGSEVGSWVYVLSEGKKFGFVWEITTPVAGTYGGFGYGGINNHLDEADAGGLTFTPRPSTSGLNPAGPWLSGDKE